MLSAKETSDLIYQAEQVKQFAYAPYSGFSVGAALLCADGKVFTGCNVENASYSATVCAERVAILKAVSQGMTNFRAIAVVGGQSELCTPCGVCQQTLSEFCSDDFLVVLARSQTDFKIFTFKDILPMPFKLKK